MDVRAILIMFPTYVDATVLEISAERALLLLDEPFVLGRDTPCTLRILTLSGRHALQLEARVSHCDGPLRLGLVLGPLPPAAEDMLRRLTPAPSPRAPRAAPPAPSAGGRAATG